MGRIRRKGAFMPAFNDSGMVNLKTLQPERPVCTDQDELYSHSDCIPKDKIPDYSKFQLVLPDDVRGVMASKGWTVDGRYRLFGKGIYSAAYDLIYADSNTVDDDNQYVEFKLDGSTHMIVSVVEFDGGRETIRINLDSGNYSELEHSDAHDDGDRVSPVVNRIDSQTKTMVASIPPVTHAVVTDSTVNAPHVVAGALKAVEEFAGPDRYWSFENPTGRAFSAYLPDLKLQLSWLKEYLKSKAGLGPEGQAKVNCFLKENGFDVKLQGLLQPNDIAAASVLDIAVTWADKGTATTLRLEDSSKSVDAVSMEKIHTAYKVGRHDYPIVSISTNNGVEVFMTRYDGQFTDSPTSISDWCVTIDQSLDGSRHEEVAGVTFPMVDYDETGKIDWLIGARSTDDQRRPMQILEALFQHRLRMNEEGARAQAATAIAVTRGINIGGPEPVVIDGPFVVWFKTLEGIIPFSAYITEEAMKRPENLR